MKLKVVLMSFLLSLIVSVHAAAENKELKVYCGSTMFKAVTEIANNFEKKNGCKVTIVPGASGDLKLMLVNFKNGDIYLPGDENFITVLEKDNPGLIVEKGHVGNNRAVLLVKKGNPKSITGVEDLTRTDLKIVLGHPERGSIGKLTAAILKQKGIFEKVMAKEKSLETESNAIMSAINKKDIDVTVNWKAAASAPEYQKSLDILPIPEILNPVDKLIMAVLETSQNIDLAQEFLKYSSSSEGRNIFDKYGLQ